MTFDIIIINYNYASFLRECIDSALAQDYNNVRVIVVDDGSTDLSKEIMQSYGDSIRSLYQPNRGMMEASNNGFKESNADFIMFLDADDYLYTDAISLVEPLCCEGISKVHFRLDQIDNSKTIVGQTPALKYKLDDGDVKTLILTAGAYVGVPTSGNVYSRKALEKFFPLNANYNHSASGYLGRIPTDAYLKFRVPFEGPVNAIQHSLGVYRMHGSNNGATMSPFFNLMKRARMLWSARDFTIFLSAEAEKIGSYNAKVSGPSKSSDILLLRLIALRFDGNGAWKDDTVVFLAKNYFARFLDTSFRTRYSVLRELVNSVMFCVIAILPRPLGKRLFRGDLK